MFLFVDNLYIYIYIICLPHLYMSVVRLEFLTLHFYHFYIHLAPLSHPHPYLPITVSLFL